MDRVMCLFMLSKKVLKSVSVGLQQLVDRRRLSSEAADTDGMYPSIQVVDLLPACPGVDETVCLQKVRLLR